LARELKEELGIRARIGPEIIRYTHEYSGRAAILLVFYHVTEFVGIPQSLAFEQIVWASREELPKFDFLEGDTDFVRHLADGHYHR
jgi:8-oxo-dGTP pyrophosphatase MutT (NUDIX family)